MSRPLCSTVLALVALTLLSTLFTAPAAASAPEELVLENGMRVILFPLPGSGMVASNVFVGAGSTREEAQYAGSSHFLEHLLFNGTTRRTQEEIYAAADRIGAYNNATTRQEYTHYMMVVPVERMDDAIDIQADMLLHSTLPVEKFEKERGIVLEELSKDKDDPDYAMERVLGELLYGPENAFARPVLGTEETISSLPRERVIEYYKRQYVPSNMRMVLMGDFERDAALEIIRSRFRADPMDGPQGQDLPAASEPPLPGPPCAPVAPGDALMRGSEGAKPTIELVLTLPRTTPADAAVLALLAHIAGGGKANRITQVLDQEPPISHEETTASLGFKEGATVFTLRARLTDGPSTAQAGRRLLAVLHSLASIGDAEFQAARTALLSAEVSQLEKLHYYAIFEGDRLWHMPEGFTEAYVSAIEDATARSAEDMARRVLATAPMQIVAAGSGVVDGKEPLDEMAPGEKMIASLEPQESTPAEEPAHRRPARLHGDEAPAVIELENGLTIVHTATPNTRMFALHLLVKNRSLREPAGETGLADLLHRSMAAIAESRGGAAASPLDQIGATLKVADSPWIPYDDYYTTPLYSFVRLECVDEYYEDALALLARMLRGPYTDDAIETARKEMIAAIERGVKPSDRSRARFNELLYPGHPLARPVMGDAATVSAITPEQVNDAAADYLAPGQMILSIVGNVPRDEALTAVRATLGALPGDPAPDTAAPALPLTGEATREVIEGGGNQSSIRMGRVFEVDPADRWPLTVAVRIASEHMQQDLRETRGLAYSLGLAVDYEGERGVLTAAMGTRPENLEEAEAGVRSYFTAGALQADADEVEKAVNGYLSRMRMRRITSMGRAFNLGVDLFLNGGIDYARREAAGLEAVTPEDVARVAARYLVDAPAVTVIVR